MTKKELIEKLAKRVGITSSQVEKTLDLFFEEMTDQLTKDRKLVVSGFGTFSSVSVDNIKFSPAIQLRESVQRTKEKRMTIIDADYAVDKFPPGSIRAV